jgi:hypothetical protein
MSKSKAKNTDEKKKSSVNYEDELFKTGKEKPDEIESDGSASAFEETERVNEDNFDDLSEK